ncbi:MAG: flagellar FlbD family protein [Abditibacteriales bacterium]|nr:flagellar FlbD family protein [Abditibacteriales bacterium]
MIHLTRTDGADIVLNAQLIEIVEATPDTVISLTTGRKVLVRESVGQVVNRVIAYERRVHSTFRRRGRRC